MRSMTGFGKARVRENNIEVDIDIKSINGRFLDLRIYLPRELNYFEHIVRKQCSERLSPWHGRCQDYCHRSQGTKYKTESNQAN